MTKSFRRPRSRTCVRARLPAPALPGRDFAVGGLCSAAYHALRAAVAGLPVNRLLMVNPQNFRLERSRDAR